MRNRAVRLLRAVGLLLPSGVLFAVPSASAQDAADRDAPAPDPPSPMPVRRGLQLGARVGYALPVGRLGGDASGASASISDLETAIVPVGVDAGVRLSPRVYVGGTGVWALGTAPHLRNNPCQQLGVSCSRQDAQVRGEARFYFAPDANVGGWAALGAGWELASFAQTVGARTTTATRTGPILPDMQLGFDMRHGTTAVAFYFGVSLAMYLTRGVDPASAPVATWIEDRDVHVWVTFGMRGSYGPW
jgi:hypothetical protein